MAKTAFKGTPVTLAGEFVKAGTSAPEFTLVKGDLSNYTLKDGMLQSCSTLAKELLGAVIGPWLISWSTT